MFNDLIPELCVSDMAKSLAFYVDVLGFKKEYERVEKKFAFLSYGKGQLMIKQINGVWTVGPLEKPFGRGVNFQIETPDIQDVSNRLSRNKVGLFEDISDSRYKTSAGEFLQKELLVQDPDGYLLRFSQTIGCR